MLQKGQSSSWVGRLSVSMPLMVAARNDLVRGFRATQPKYRRGCLKPDDVVLVVQHQVIAFNKPGSPLSATG